MNRQQFNSKMKKATSKEERISLSDTYAGELFEKNAVKRQRFSRGVEADGRAQHQGLLHGTDRHLPLQLRQR